MPADAPLLRRWDEDPAVRASDPDDWWDWDVDLDEPGPWVELLIAEEAGRPVGFLQLLDVLAEPTGYWPGGWRPAWGPIRPGTWAVDLWLGAPADRGRGLGTVMMLMALARCRDVHGAGDVLVDPLATNVRAHALYRRCGFVLLGPTRFGGDDCLVLRSPAPAGSAPPTPRGPALP